MIKRPNVIVEFKNEINKLEFEAKQIRVALNTHAFRTLEEKKEAELRMPEVEDEIQFYYAKEQEFQSQYKHSKRYLNDVKERQEAFNHNLKLQTEYCVKADKLIAKFIKEAKELYIEAQGEGKSYSYDEYHRIIGDVHYANGSVDSNSVAVSVLIKLFNFMPTFRNHV
jgi:hypothetical protein